MEQKTEASLNITEETINSFIEINKNSLFDDVLPFWKNHHIDHEYGGFFNYLGRDGSVLHTDKNVRHLGRFTWLYALFYNEYEKNEEWLKLALNGIDFIEKYCFDRDGRTFYEVTREGVPVRKRRYVITEHYTVMAYVQLFLATGNQEWKQKAEKLYKTILMFYHNPELLPPKFYPVRKTKAHNIPMIIVCSTQQMRLMGDDELYRNTIDYCLNEVYSNFLNYDKKALLETVYADGSFLETPEGRTINPGHSIESAWFTMEEARYRGDQELLKKALTVLDWALEWGWDKEHGGILYFVNVDGHPCDQYEHELKLWWPQNEAIYACLLAYYMTREEKYWDWFCRIHDYAYTHFPDKEHGDWFKYLRRDGTLSSEAKGTRWAGMFHHARMMWNNVKLLEELKRDLK